MSRKYKFQNLEGLYFVSFAVVNWIDLFVRDCYCMTFIDSLNYCRKQRGMEIFAWCIMPSHVHLVFRAKDGNPASLIGRLKEFTSKKLQNEITENPQESRKEWMLWMMERAAMKSSKVSKRQLWQHHNQPIELWSPWVVEQKVEYIHRNPVEAGLVLEPWQWKYSSAIDYSGGKGVLEIDYL
jgi:REP element-mobilizing transposase RayT